MWLDGKKKIPIGSTPLTWTVPAEVEARLGKGGVTLRLTKRGYYAKRVIWEGKKAG